MDALEKAYRYIEEHHKEVSPRYRQLFHAMPPLNWCNDPNGFSYYKEKFHLFFQFYPYENKWGPMHWGHLTSDDLLHYEDHYVALAPSFYESRGCFSGTAITNPFGKDELLLYYTSHNEEEGKTTEETSLAMSTDGLHFVKKGKVIEQKDIPPLYSQTDFRDPKAYYENGYLYLVHASNKNGEGCLLVYRGSSIDSFFFHMEIKLKEMGIQAECPDLIKIGNKYLLLFSAIHKESKSTNLYAVLNLDLENKHYEVLNVDTLDYGSDFYAAQGVKVKEKAYLTAWLESWKKKYDFIENKEGWNGSFSLPRELTLEGNRLIQRPLRAFYDNLGEIVHEGPISEAGLLKFKLLDNEELILDDGVDKDSVSIKRRGNELVITLYSDSEKVEQRMPYEGTNIEAIIDKASLEIYLPTGIFASFAHYFTKKEIKVKGPDYSFRPYMG